MVNNNWKLLYCHTCQRQCSLRTLWFRPLLRWIQGEKLVRLVRGQQERFSLNKILLNNSKKFRLFPGDKIFVQVLNYKPETVIVMGETGIKGQSI